jgi:hypothetical protein
VPCGIVVRFGCPLACGLTRKLFVGDYFAEIGDVLLDSGDLLGPGAGSLVRNSRSVFSFRFGKRVDGVLQFLFERWAGHMRRVSLAYPARALN